jgi:hypothetical protein
MTNTWMNDPAIAHIDKTKLEFLQDLVFESQSMKKEQMLPFLMAIAKRGQENHITFSDQEIDTIIDTIKKYSTPEELERINKMLKLRKK